jgi:hypothetical protein
MQAFLCYWSIIVIDWHEIVIKLAIVRGRERLINSSFFLFIGHIVIDLVI